MNLKELRAKGAFVPIRPVRKEVPINRPILKPESEWADPKIPEFTGDSEPDTVTVYIHRGYAADSLEMLTASPRERPFVAILRCVMDKDGRPVFNSLSELMGDPTLGADDPGALADWLVYPLYMAISEVAKDAPKVFQAKTNGGSKRASRTASPKANSSNE